MNKFFLVGVGGFVGSILRYWFSGLVQQWMQNAAFPFGTLAVNVIGCLIIGFLSQLADARGVFTAETRALVFVGVLGGFTTFSSFANESNEPFPRRRVRKRISKSLWYNLARKLIAGKIQPPKWGFLVKRFLYARQTGWN